MQGLPLPDEHALESRSTKTIKAQRTFCLAGVSLEMHCNIARAKRDKKRYGLEEEAVKARQHHCGVEEFAMHDWARAFSHFHHHFLHSLPSLTYYHMYTVDVTTCALPYHSRRRALAGNYQACHYDETYVVEAFVLRGHK